jgi:hypothetical protein
MAEPLERRVRARADDLSVAERAAALACDEQLPALRAEAAALTRRDQLQRRFTLLRRIAELEREAAEAHAGRDAAAFAAVAAPYVRAQQQQLFTRPHGTADAQRQLVSDYERLEGGGTVAFAERDACGRCGGDLGAHAQLALLVCRSCGHAVPLLDSTSNLLSYSESGYDWSGMCARRSSHYDSWLNALQGRERTDVSDETLQGVMAQLRAAGVEPHDVTVQHVRNALRASRSRKLYDHATLIYSRITGQQPLRLEPQQEQELKLLFASAVASFNRCAPAGRSGLLSYGHLTRRLAELLGLHEFAELFPPIACREKAARQEAFWLAICRDLGWSPPGVDRKRALPQAAGRNARLCLDEGQQLRLA